MNSLDFLTPREVIGDCIRLAAVPSLAVGCAGGVYWALCAALGTATDEEVVYALLMPFAFTAIYGNAVIYNTRWKHGIGTFSRPWWFRLTCLAVAWTLGSAVTGLTMELTLVQFGVLNREPKSLIDGLQFLGLAGGFAVIFALIPARTQYVT